MVSSTTTAAVAAPPMIAPAPVTRALEEANTRMANRSPVVAPRVKPTMSGLPSGLRETLWKIAPDIPSMPPMTTAPVTRGSRCSRTMKGAKSSPLPWNTSRSMSRDTG